MKQILFYLLIMTFSCNIIAQQVIPLYGKVPNNIDTINSERNVSGGKMVSKVSNPSLKVFLPTKDKATHMAVIICPGGGYMLEAIAMEGYDVAAKLNEMGIAAFVLKYRIPEDSKMTHKEICPLQDAQRAIQIVREHANEYNVDTALVGIMGFSAGGHLAATASTHYQKAYIQNDNKTNLRPSFSILIYPVISFTNAIMHEATKIRLVGKSPSPELINDFSNELQVNKNTPPAFLLCAQDDGLVNPLNSIVYFNALTDNKVRNCELHIYPSGGHGFGMNIPNSEVHWMDQLQNWLSLLIKKLKS